MAIKNKVHQDIIDAMQGLEELGGVNDTREYIEILNSIKKDIETRITNAASTPDACVRDITGCGCISCFPPSGAV